MAIHAKQCKTCAKTFQIPDEDQEFYIKMQVTKPDFCPSCRQQRRLAFRNEFYLYQRKCDFSGKEIISMYSPDKPYKIYDQETWWSDKWDPMQFGRDFDFNKPFFEQFIDLQKSVPRMSLNVISSENSYYTNYAFRNKNCYMVFTTDYCEDSYYGRINYHCFKCVDFDYTNDSTHCYEVFDAKRCNNCHFSQKISGCSNLLFCYDMKNCHDCIGCANLRNKKYYIHNKEATKEEYEKIIKKMDLGSYKGLQKAKKQTDEFLLTCPKKHLENVNSEDCIGNFLKNSKNAKFCFDSEKLHDVKYATQLNDAKDSQDWDFVAEGSELCYQMVSSAIRMIQCKFCMNSWEGNSNISYCDLCLGNSNIFGCVGLRKKHYCILNKEYTKEEYEEIIPRINEHMKQTGEFSQFFPAQASPFGYNESVASEYFPLKKEDALKLGFTWKDNDKKDYKKQTYIIPDQITQIPSSITNETLACEVCGKNYKITSQELEFYKKSNLPIPHSCYLCRHKTRMAKKNPRKLWEKSCAKCGIKTQTTYPPENPSPILCEKCYLEHVG
ncbi:MAG: hypothetical protein US89_C0004G0112 [Candidatus Peregrinibacteria bacterium GW2011_GWF2_38_29]|nr:MAG: hypothetical protein US89_C0004G0112 [Candidatus Peregrinibacteria bacterium GW2011_GWF2_38_29]HBB02500.1 hypothetical protein [Candidatus Peregrinibacteria bacterium]